MKYTKSNTGAGGRTVKMLKSAPFKSGKKAPTYTPKLGETKAAGHLRQLQQANKSRTRGSFQF